MQYERRNGKFYEVREVDISQIEKEVKQVVAYISQQETSIKPLNERIVAIEARKKVELEKLNAEIVRVSALYDNEISAYKNEISNHKNNIANAVESLKVKKDIINAAFPAESAKLGF